MALRSNATRLPRYALKDFAKLDGWVKAHLDGLKRKLELNLVLCIPGSYRFTIQLREDYVPDDEYARLREALIERPEPGALIPGSGGVRKLR